VRRASSPATSASSVEAMAANDPAPLRVAVMVERPPVPAWVAWTIGRIDSMQICDVEAIVEVPPDRRRHAQPPLGYRLYERIDEWVFGPASAMRDADLTLTHWRTRLPQSPLDVVVSFVPVGRSQWPGPPPRHGVWAIVPADVDRRRPDPSRFWDVCTRRPRTATGVVAMRDRHPDVLARASAPTDPLSVTRTRDAAAWASARLLVDTLTAIHRGDPPLAGDHELWDAQRAPAPGVITAHALRTAAGGIAAKSRKLWLRGEWFVAVRAKARDGHGGDGVRTLPNPPGCYLGDPFPIEMGGRHYLFVEQFSMADRRGVISVLEPQPDGSWSQPRPVLQRDHHLSYPFVFDLEGTAYMLPETGDAGRIELYRALDFPDRWERDRVLIDGLTAFDATLHVENGLFWLFANVAEERPGDTGELRLYWSRALEGEWRSHPANPITRDAAGARPAGRLFHRAGMLIRPAQDCSRRYGEAVVLHRVEVLSTTEYRETPVGRIEADWMPGIEATHTYTFDSRYECLDAYRRVRRLAPLL
jgi:hypothetical protein